MDYDFFDLYLQYTKDTEATSTFHRWAAIVGIGALLERNIWIQHGASHIYPNHYVMLLGESGSRKSAAIKGFVRVLKQAGYTTLAAEKTSKEKFSQDLAAMHHTESADDEILFGDVDDRRRGHRAGWPAPGLAGRIRGSGGPSSPGRRPPSRR